MTPTQQTSALTLPPTSSTDSAPADPSFGARLAVASRRAQGLPAVVADEVVRERLRALCSLPLPWSARSGVPDQFDPSGE